MPNKAFGWLTRIKAVEREFNVVSLATQRLQQQALVDPAILTGGLRHRDIGAVVDHLDGTYVIRLFAEFETSLRKFLRDLKYPEPRRTETLINRVRDRSHIPNNDAVRAHAVRDYRNALVHDRLEPIYALSVRECTRNLCTFLSWMQRMW